jgi:putative transposase
VARLARLSLPGHAHWLVQRGLPGRAVFVDDEDRRLCLQVAQAAARAEKVRLHAYALPDGVAHWLVTPDDTAALSRFVQAIGRRYVSAYNRRHGGAGTLWEGRFRCAPVEPGDTTLEVLALLDGGFAGVGLSSAEHRLSDRPAPWLVNPPEFWRLGNTPFERQARWHARLAEGVAAERRATMERHAMGGWALGSTAFVAQVAEQAGRPAAPRPRGRPARTTA